MRPRPPLRALALLSAALCAGVAVAPRSAHAQLNAAAAQARFDRGRELFLARNFAGALEEFRAANELVGSPNTRLYLARCLRELGRLADAFVEFQRAAAEAADRATQEPRYASTRDNARAEGNALQARLGRLTLRVSSPPENLTITVNTHAVARPAWGLATPVDPGSLAVVASAPGFTEFRRTFTVAEGEALEVPIVLTRAATPEPPARAIDPPPRLPPPLPLQPPETVEVRTTVGGGARIAGGVLLGVGVGAVAAFAGLAAAAQGRYNELQMQCGAAGCSQAQISSGVTLQTAGNAMLVTGLVLVAGGVIMVAAGGPRTVVERRPVVSARLSPSVAADGRSVALGLAGSF